MRDGRIFLIQSETKGVFFLRFAVCAEHSQSKHVHFAFTVLQECADTLLGGHHKQNGHVAGQV